MLRAGMWISLAVPALVFAFAGISKIADSFPVGDFLARVLYLPLPSAAALGKWIGIVEVALAGGLCLFHGRSRIPVFLALCMLAMFSGLLIEAMYFWPDLATCACLGNLSAGSFKLSPMAQLAIDAGLFLLLCSHLLLLQRFMLEGGGM